ncbi:MAG: hypothetical protein ACI4QD_08525 [Kiritimatiellia bacterium]
MPEPIQFLGARPVVRGLPFASFEAVWETPGLPCEVAPRCFADTRDELYGLIAEVPFSRGDWSPAPQATRCHQEAFGLLGRPCAGDYVLRVVPGFYLAVGRPSPRGWDVFLLGSERVVMTVRMEELCGRLPRHLRREGYAVSIRRDAKLGESGEVVEEVFSGVGWDARIRLILAENGGAIVRIEA